MDAKAAVDQGPEWSPVEIAYAAWLRAARESARSGSAVVRRMHEWLSVRHKLDGLPEKWQTPYERLGDDGRKTGWQSSYYAQWEKGRSDTRRPSLPAEAALQDALVDAVTGLVATPPEGAERYVSFAAVVERLATERSVARNRGGSATKQLAADRKWRDEASLLVVPPAKAAELDPLALGLGSWAFEGGLPPYVSRTIDPEIVKSLEAGNPGLTVIVGAPKSGKSRTVLELLRSELPDAITWWVNCAPTVLQAVISRIRALRDLAPIVVLDDAHLLGANPTDGLTFQRLAELTRRTRVVLTLHESALVAWELDTADRRSATFPVPARIAPETAHRTPSGYMSFGATPELVRLIRSASLRLSPVLDATEYAAAAPGYEDVRDLLEGLDLSRLAETYAAVEQLRLLAHAMQSEGGIGAAMVEALIDATILYPAGAPLKTLEVLVRQRWTMLAPNGIWREPAYGDVLELVTRGVSTGSPHALMIRRGEDRYALLDALLPVLRTDDRQIAHLSAVPLGGKPMFRAGLWALEQGRDDEARAWWLRAISVGHKTSMRNLGSLCAERGDVAGARRWWTKAAEAGVVRAALSLAILAKREGDVETARSWLLKELGGGNPEAMVSLGVLAVEAGDQQGARTWWQQAADADMDLAMLNLGTLSHQAGDSETAQHWWLRAARAGNDIAMLKLASYLRELGDVDGARSWWLRRVGLGGEAGGLAEALCSLGLLAYDSDEVEEAKGWWFRAAALGDAHALVGLGALAHNAGDLKAARGWWIQAAENGRPEAMYHLGRIAYRFSGLGGPADWWQLDNEPRFELAWEEFLSGFARSRAEGHDVIH